MNLISLSGTIISDQIELRECPNGILVTSFLLKVKREKKKHESADELYDVVTIVCWEDMAKFVSAKYKYGMVIEVRGSIRTGRRKLKDYVVYKCGREIKDFRIPVFEVYATRVDEISG